MKNCIRIVSAVALGAILPLAKASAAPPPVANFLASPTEGVAPLTVYFTDTSVGPINDWLWDFGDNTTTNMAFSADLTHTYAIPATYSLQLTVSGPGGVSVFTQPDLITVVPEPSALLLVGFGLSLFGMHQVGKFTRITRNRCCRRAKHQP